MQLESAVLHQQPTLLLYATPQLKDHIWGHLQNICQNNIFLTKDPWDISWEIKNDWNTAY